MRTTAVVAFAAFCSMHGAGCREKLVATDDEGSLPPAGATMVQRLEFSWTGSPNPHRSFMRLRAGYNAERGVTFLETLDDSVSAGKLVMEVQGFGAGRYVYDVTGSEVDTHQVYLRYVPLYTNGVPGAVFELTGNGQDSLGAEVTIRSFGGVRDSIIGSFDAVVIDRGSGIKVLLSNGGFVAQRQQ